MDNLAKIGGLLALIVFTGVVYLIVSMMRSNNEKAIASNLQTFSHGKPQAQPITPPNSATTAPPAGFTGRLSEGPYSQTQPYEKPLEFGQQCSDPALRPDPRDIVNRQPEFPQGCPEGYEKKGMMCFSSNGNSIPATECKPGQDRHMGLCYPKCPDGFVGRGNLCLRCARY